LAQANFLALLRVDGLHFKLPAGHPREGTEPFISARADRLVENKPESVHD
jgi:hypothetical protein